MVKNLSLRAVSIYLRLLEVETVCIINFYAHVVSIQKTPLGVEGWVKELEKSPISPPPVHQTPSLL